MVENPESLSICDWTSENGTELMLGLRPWAFGLGSWALGLGPWVFGLASWVWCFILANHDQSPKAKGQRPKAKDQSFSQMKNGLILSAQRLSNSLIKPGMCRTGDIRNPKYLPINLYASQSLFS